MDNDSERKCNLVLVSSDVPKLSAKERREQQKQQATDRARAAKHAFDVMGVRINHLDQIAGVIEFTIQQTLYVMQPQSLDSDRGPLLVSRFAHERLSFAIGMLSSEVSELRRLHTADMEYLDRIFGDERRG